MNFTIDSQYLCDEIVRKEWSMFDGIPQDQLTAEQLIKALKGEDRMVYTSARDHPEFDKLRNRLEAEGYIKTERSFWNGDRVIKPFVLNGWKFKKGQLFPCAVALGSTIACAKKNKWKSLHL